MAFAHVTLASARQPNPGAFWRHDEGTSLKDIKRCYASAFLGLVRLEDRKEGKVRSTMRKTSRIPLLTITAGLFVASLVKDCLGVRLANLVLLGVTAELLTGWLRGDSDSDAVLWKPGILRLSFDTGNAPLASLFYSVHTHIFNLRLFSCLLIDIA